MKKICVLPLSILMIFLLCSCSGESDKKTENQNSDNNIETEIELTIRELPDDVSKVDYFIDEFNKTSLNSITDISEFTVQDRDSGHYQVEFRLGPFSKAYAKTGKINDCIIDIVCCGYDLKSIRIYAIADLEQAKEIIKYSSSILDSKLTETDIQEVLDYLDNHKSANGYYYGDLGLVFLGDELMLKLE